MQIGLIGLGKMGIHLAQNMMNNGNDVVAFDLDQDLVDEAASYGATKSSSLEDMVAKLDKPRTVPSSGAPVCRPSRGRGAIRRSFP